VVETSVAVVAGLQSGLGALVVLALNFVLWAAVGADTVVVAQPTAQLEEAHSCNSLLDRVGVPFDFVFVAAPAVESVVAFVDILQRFGKPAELV